MPNTQTMTPKERVQAAIRGEAPDTTPVDLHNFLLCAELTGRPYGEIFTDPARIAESQLEAQKLFGHDMLLVEVGIATEAQALGCTVDYPADAAPWIKKPALTGYSPAQLPSVIASMEVPDPQSSPSMKIMLDAVSILLEKKGDELFIMGRADQGPFSLAASTRGMSDFLIDLVSGESYIPDLLRFTTEVHTRYAEALMDTGAHATSMGDSLAGPDVVSPDFYRNHALSYEQEVFSRLHSRKFTGANHICGRVDDILPDMVLCGADILEIDEKTDLARAEKAARGKAALLGPVSPALMQTGSPQEVAVAARQALDTMNGNPRFILGPGCALSGKTPVKNVQALIQTARPV